MPPFSCSTLGKVPDHPLAPHAIAPFRQRARPTAGTFFALKTRACPHCRRAGHLNRHSLLRGNDPGDPGASLLRGQRVFCSNRGRRGGCGRTAPLFLAAILPGHTVSAGCLDTLLEAMRRTQSLRAAAHSLRLPFPLETLYALLRRMRLRLSRIRTGLFGAGPPPAACAHADPLLHAFEHLRALFAAHPCPGAAFALAHQRAWIA